MTKLLTSSVQPGSKFGKSTQQTIQQEQHIDLQKPSNCYNFPAVAVVPLHVCRKNGKIF